MPQLNERYVKSAPAPASGNKIHYDEAIKGFGLRITARGARSFIFNYRTEGRERRYTIGQWPSWSVTAARDEAKRLRMEVDRGYDPLEIRQQNLAAPTVSDLFERYCREHLPSKGERSAADDRSMWLTYILPKLGPRKVRSLSYQDFDRLHGEISKTKPVRANRVIEVIRKALNLAMRWGWIEQNPASGVRKNREEPRERYLTEIEIRHLLNAMDKQADDLSVGAIRLMLLTGCRKGEALSAEWTHFDLERGIWDKPSSHTKQRRRHRVPLSGPALSLIRSLPRKEKSDFLFPSSSKAGHLTDVKRTWESLKRQATLTLWCDVKQVGAIAQEFEEQTGRAPSIEDLQAEASARKISLPPGLMKIRLHDLRHTFASTLVSKGQSLPIIGQLLGHTQQQTTARYAHLFDDPLRLATEQASEFLTGKGAKAKQ